MIEAATLCDPGGLLLLACAADPAPWLGEMRDLVEEVGEAHFPELRLVATTLSDDDVAPGRPASPSDDNSMTAREARPAGAERGGYG